MMTTFLCCVIFALVGYIYHLIVERNRWRKNALGNARGRIQKGRELREQEGLLNRNAAKTIAHLKAENEDLRNALQRQKNMNRRLLEQMDRRTQEGGTT